MHMMILALSLTTTVTPAPSNGQLAQPAANQVAQAKPTTPAPERKYCIEYEDVTGSRTAGGKVCRTKAQWKREGIDIDNPSKDS